MTSTRMFRWQIIVCLPVQIVLKKGSSNGNTYVVSHLPMTSDQEVKWGYDDLFSESKEQVKLLIEDIAHRPVEAQEIKNLTDEDLVVGRVRQHILTVCPMSIGQGEELNPFLCKKKEFSLEDGVL